MQILREVDAAGVSFRSQKRFNRRIYTNKVSIIHMIVYKLCIRDPILCGTSTGMIN